MALVDYPSQPLIEAARGQVLLVRPQMQAAAKDGAFIEFVYNATLGANHVVTVGANMMTGHVGIFAGGDMVPAERTGTVGIGHGKKAARHIDAWLREAQYEPLPKHEFATFDKLNPWYYSDAPATVRPQLVAERRRRAAKGEHRPEPLIAGLRVRGDGSGA